MSIYYRFKSAKDFNRLPMEGFHLSVAEVKNRISLSKCLGGTDYDLLVTDAQTGQDYEDEGTLIRRNTSLIVRRVPGLPRPPIVVLPVQERLSVSDAKRSCASTLSSRNQGSHTGANAADESDGKSDSNCKDVRAFSWSRFGVPSQVLCPLCHIVMEDAVMTRCCFWSFCDRCVRDHIVSKGSCKCAAKICVDDLVPNNTMRKVIDCISESSSSGGCRKSALQKSSSSSSCVEQQTKGPLPKGLSEVVTHPVESTQPSKRDPWKPDNISSDTLESSSRRIKEDHPPKIAAAVNKGKKASCSGPISCAPSMCFFDGGSHPQNPYWLSYPCRSHEQMMTAPVPRGFLEHNNGADGKQTAWEKVEWVLSLGFLLVVNVPSPLSQPLFRANIYFTPDTAFSCILLFECTSFLLQHFLLPSLRHLLV